MFAYDDAITEQFPAIRAGVIHATGLTNGPSTPGLLEEYRAERRATYERLEATAIADLPSIFTSLLASHQSRSNTESWVLSPTNPRAGNGGGVEGTSR